MPIAPDSSLAARHETLTMRHASTETKMACPSMTPIGSCKPIRARPGLKRNAPFRRSLSFRTFAFDDALSVRNRIEQAPANGAQHAVAPTSRSCNAFSGRGIVDSERVGTGILRARGGPLGDAALLPFDLRGTGRQRAK